MELNPVHIGTRANYGGNHLTVRNFFAPENDIGDVQIAARIGVSAAINPHRLAFGL